MSNISRHSCTHDPPHVPHLYKSSKGWIYRRRKPEDLQPLLGPAPWETRLGTHYLPALDRCRDLTRQHDELIASLATPEAQQTFLGDTVTEAAAQIVRTPPDRKVADRIKNLWSWRWATDRMQSRLRAPTPPAREAEALRVELAVSFGDRTHVDKVPLTDPHLVAVLETVRPEPPPTDPASIWTWNQAKAGVEARLAEVEKVAPIDPAATITAMMDRYIDFQAVKPKTATNYRNRIKAFAKHAGNLQITRITPETIRKFRDFLLSADSRVSRATTQQNLNALNIVLNWAMGEGILSENPNAKVTSIGNDRTVEESNRDPFTVDQMKVVWVAVEAAWGAQGKARLSSKRRAAFHMAFRVLLWTGMRPNEVFLLTPKDVTTAEINVKLTKTGAARDLPLAAPIADFHDYLHNTGWPAFTTRAAPEKLMSEGFTKIIRKAGLTNPRHVLYSLKNTLLERLEVLGASENVQRSIIGHASGRGKLRHYKNASEVEIMPGFLDRVSYF